MAFRKSAWKISPKSIDTWTPFAPRTPQRRMWLWWCRCRPMKSSKFERSAGYFWKYKKYIFGLCFPTHWIHSLRANWNIEPSKIVIQRQTVSHDSKDEERRDRDANEPSLRHRECFHPEIIDFLERVIALEPTSFSLQLIESMNLCVFVSHRILHIFSPHLRRTGERESLQARPF